MKAAASYASAHEDAARLMRIKDDYDGAEPSGNSVALLNLLRLHRITGRADFEASARKLIARFPRESSRNSVRHAADAGRLRIRSRAATGNRGRRRCRSAPMIRLLWKNFDPNRILLHAGPKSRDVAAGDRRDELACRRNDAVYVCENFTCRHPP